MGDLIYKFITNADAKQFNDEERSFTAWASRSSMDRDEEVIEASGWITKNYRKNPVVPLFHDYRQFPIAKSAWEKPDPKDNPIGLLFKPIFAETYLGMESYYLYKEGFMSAFSVGFDPLEWMDSNGDLYSKEKDGDFLIWQKGYIEQKKIKPRCTFLKQELLEISGVLVPAHPDALIEARSFVKTPELIKHLDSLINIELKIWDETETSVRHRIRDPELFIDGSFRTVPIKRDKPRVNSVMGKLKDGDGTMKIQSLIFPKTDGWTMAKAKEWVKDHPDIGKDFDDIDYKHKYFESLVIIADQAQLILEKQKDGNIIDSQDYDAGIMINDEDIDLDEIEVGIDALGDDGNTSGDVEVLVGTGDDAGIEIGIEI